MAKPRAKHPRRRPASGARIAAPAGNGLPGQVVLVLQGGGALGAYQVGVYEALHEAGIEPDWVIGTSIGAINAAVIAGNRPPSGSSRLKAFWSRMELPSFPAGPAGLARRRQPAGQHDHHHARHPRFFRAEPGCAARHACAVGVEAAAYYSTAPLRAR